MEDKGGKQEHKQDVRTGQDRQRTETENLQGEETHSWQTQGGWIYIGHGEWAQVECDMITTTGDKNPSQEPEWVQQWLIKNDKDRST